MNFIAKFPETKAAKALVHHLETALIAAVYLFTVFAIAGHYFFHQSY